MELITVIYYLAYMIHVVAFSVGLECLRRGEVLFSNQNPAIQFRFCKIRKGRNPFVLCFNESEIQYWIVNIGTSVNFVFLLILPIYVSFNMGYMPVWEEFAFNYIHFGTGIMTTLVHCLTLKNIKNGTMGANVGKNT